MLKVTSQSQQPQLLYAHASRYRNDTWLIVPVLEADGRYSFLAFDPEGQDWCINHWTRTYRTPADAIAVGKAYVDLVLAEMQGESA